MPLFPNQTQEKFKALVHLYFAKKWQTYRYKYFVLGRDKPYLAWPNHFDSYRKYSGDDICRMLDFLLMFGERVFQQTLPVTSTQ